MAKFPKVAFPILLFVFQVIILGLYAGYVDYTPNAKIVDSVNNYPQFQDVHVMVFVGIGFLLTFLRKYGYGGVSYNFLLGAIVVQWATLVNAWISQRVKQEEGLNPEHVTSIKVNIQSLMAGDFAAATVLISFCGFIGKTNQLQLLTVAILEPIFYAINETVINEYLHIADTGGSILVHLFGAYFGIGVTIMIQNNREHENESSVYHSDLFSMIGTLFLWVYWPSFNAALLGGQADRQNRAIVNTYFSLAACVVTTFIMSMLITKKFKLNMVHIQNATLAGGVAVGASADLLIHPWGAILIGMIAGIISTLGFSYVTPFMRKRLRIHDVCGINNLHGMPGIFAGIVGAVAAATIDKTDYTTTDFKKIYKKVGRSSSEQAGYQFAGVCVGFAISLTGGIITGSIAKIFGTVEDDALYNDDKDFEVPALENSYIVNQNNHEMKIV